MDLRRQLVDEVRSIFWPQFRGLQSLFLESFIKIKIIRLKENFPHQLFIFLTDEENDEVISVGFRQIYIIPSIRPWIVKICSSEVKQIGQILFRLYLLFS
jgi:hypothetical protein